MPIHLPAQNRRHFLISCSSGALVFTTSALCQQRNYLSVDDDLVCLLNDTHVGEKHPDDSPVPTHLRQAVNEIVQMQRSPAAILINGDLALKDGQPGDYRHFAKLLAPLDDAGLSVHLTLGNHDNREVFYDVMKSQRPEQPPVPSRHISIVQTRLANFFLLDSLQETMVTQGTLGPQQLTWLATSLDAHHDRPAVIVSHHNPRLGGDPKHFPGGLIDSAELWDVLATRSHVKAYIHGHIHDRSNAEHRGIHIVNTPATSYVANAELSTTGWTSARLTTQGMTLKTHTSDTTHPWQGQEQTLRWR